MNNYLSSIAARTLNPAPPVRPRLSGRFDPAPPIEAPIDQPKPSTKIEPVAPLITVESKTPPTVGDGSSLKSGTPAMEPRAPIQTTRPPSRNQQADYVPSPAALDKGLPSRSSPVQASNFKSTSRDDGPALRDQASPSKTESARESQKQADGANQVLRTVRAATLEPNSPKSRATEGDPRRLHNPPPVSIEPTQTNPSNQPTAALHEQPKTLVNPSERQKPNAEREIKTIVREEHIIKLQAEPSETKPKPFHRLVAPQAPDNSRVIAKTSPVAVDSRIAPLIEKVPEPISLARWAAQPQPTVHVTIGRVEVRAIQQSQAPRKPRPTPPVMNLDDYLSRRNQGSAR